MEWIDKSDAKTRFFVAESDVDIEGASFIGLIHDVLDFLLGRILESSDRVAFDTLFLEVNCDTGRMIVSPSTERDRINGTLHGCAVRLTQLQDFWYDLDESGVSGEEFEASVRGQVRRIGVLFESAVQKRRDEFIRRSQQHALKLIVFGNEPEKILLRTEITSQ